jgi:ABC-type multidrug transport system fused ATPase/permease subunit
LKCGHIDFQVFSLCNEFKTKIKKIDGCNILYINTINGKDKSNEVTILVLNTFMQSVINLILSNPLYIGITVVFLLILIFVLVKQLFKLMLYVILAFVLLVGVVYYFNIDVRETVDESKAKTEQIIKEGEEQIDQFN